MLFDLKEIIKYVGNWKTMLKSFLIALYFPFKKSNFYHARGRHLVSVHSGIYTQTPQTLGLATGKHWRVSLPFRW